MIPRLTDWTRRFPSSSRHRFATSRSAQSVVAPNSPSRRYSPLRFSAFFVLVLPAALALAQSDLFPSPATGRLAAAPGEGKPNGAVIQLFAEQSSILRSAPHKVAATGLLLVGELHPFPGLHYGAGATGGDVTTPHDGSELIVAPGPDSDAPSRVRGYLPRGRVPAAAPAIDFLAFGGPSYVCPVSAASYAGGANPIG